MTYASAHVIFFIHERLLLLFLGCFLGSFLSRSGLCFHGSLEVSEYGEVTEGGLLYLRHFYLRLFCLSGFLGSLSGSLFALLPSTEVRNEDTFCVAVEDFEASGIK